MPVMRPSTLAAIALSTFSFAFLAPALRAEDGDKPKTEQHGGGGGGDKKEKPAGPKLFGIYAKMKTLSAEQRIKINEIHERALKAKREIEEKEKEEITALLTTENKTEIASIEEADKAKAKEREANRKKEGEAGGANAGGGDKKKE
jgi:Spy/CpxP family protein refolding chaperone